MSSRKIMKKTMYTYSQTPLCQTLDSLNHSYVYHLDYPYIGIDDKGKDRDVHDKFSRKINK